MLFSRYRSEPPLGHFTRSRRDPGIVARDWGSGSIEQKNIAEKVQSPAINWAVIWS